MKEPDTGGIPRFEPLGSGTWIDSLRSQFREYSEARANPREKFEPTASADPSALGKMVLSVSPIESLYLQVRTLFDEYRNPPEKFEPTAAPVETDPMWTAHNTRGPGAISFGVHLVVGILLVVPLFTGVSRLPGTETTVQLFEPLILDLPPLDENVSGGGGGGGLEMETPPSLGELPEAADEQFVPPAPPETINPNPVLVMAPSVVVPQLADRPAPLDLAMIGAPDGIPGPPSAGPGTGFGIGTGQGRGIGEGEGPGVGPGEGGGIGGDIFRIGGGVTAPIVISQVQPEYSEEARKARYEGVVVLEAIVHADGTIEIQRVVRGLGFGLDQKAIEALEQWKFRPGMMGGEAVSVAINIEVNFNLR
jgi:TonB family protein